MLFRVDPASSQPIFAQIAASVRRELREGRLVVGDRLPSAKEVAASLDVNLHTVLRAYQELRDEGLVDLRRGRGAVIVHPRAGAQASVIDAARALARAATAAGLSQPEAAALLAKEWS